MSKYRVLVTLDASTSVVVEADSEEQAKELAMEEATGCSLCYHCSRQVSLGDPLDAIEVLPADDE